MGLNSSFAAYVQVWRFSYFSSYKLLRYSKPLITCLASSGRGVFVATLPGDPNQELNSAVSNVYMALGEGWSTRFI